MIRPNRSDNAVRRRLLKGLAGGAGIYTLPVGAQVANGSVGACVLKSQTLTAPKAVLTTDPDTYVRVKMPYYVGEQQPQVKYLRWRSTWYKVSGTAPKYTAAATSFPDASLNTNTPSGYLYALVDYSGRNSTLQVYPADPVISEPISTASCWNSVKAATLPKAGARNLLDVQM